MCCTWPAVTRSLTSVGLYQCRWVLLLSRLLAPARPMAGGYADLNSWAFDLSDRLASACIRSGGGWLWAFLFGETGCKLRLVPRENRGRSKHGAACVASGRH